MSNNQNLSGFKPLIPVDNTGMDEIADELMNYKPKEKPKAEEIKEEPAQPVQQQANPNKWTLGGKISAALLAVGFGALFTLLGYTCYAQDKKSEAYYSRNTLDCTEHQRDLENSKFSFDVARFKACMDRTMEITIHPGEEDAYRMINNAEPEGTLVDKVITGGKEYVRSNSGSNPAIFETADKMWKEYWEKMGCTRELNEWAQWIEAQKKVDSIFTSQERAE